MGIIGRFACFSLAFASLSLLSGCANILFRTSLSSDRIEELYMPTRAQAEFVHACACPQAFFMPTGRAEFCLENVFTLPLAIVPAADLVVEAALDTVFLPVDYALVSIRKE